MVQLLSFVTVMSERGMVFVNVLSNVKKASAVPQPLRASCLLVRKHIAFVHHCRQLVVACVGRCVDQRAQRQFVRVAEWLHQRAIPRECEFGQFERHATLRSIRSRELKSSSYTAHMAQPTVTMP